MQAGEDGDAKLRYVHALAAHREHNNAQCIADTLIELGRFHTRLDEQDVALELFAEAEQLYGAIDGQSELGYVHAGRGDIALSVAPTTWRATRISARSPCSTRWVSSR